MTAPDPDLDLGALVIEEIPPPPPGAPRDLREQLALHLKTTSPDVLRDAETAYRGIWPSARDYILDQLAPHLPPYLDWLPLACDPEALRRGYEADKLIVWTIPLSEETCLVFESLRDPAPLDVVEPAD